MQAKKIPSTLSRVVGVQTKNAIDFDGSKWIMGSSTGANIEYMYDMQDLIKYAHLFIRQIEKNENKQLKKIAVSIPTESYYSSKYKDDGGLIEEMKSNILKNMKNIEDVVVLPQGAIALNYLVKQGKIKLSDGNILVIDGGFNTLNISIVDKNGEILFTESIHDELGVYNLLHDFFREELKAKYSEVAANVQMLKKVFLEERIDAGFNVINVKNEKQRALQAFIPKLIERVKRDIKKGKASFEQFVFVGGISYYIDKKDIETNRKFYVPENNGEFLTVLGMKETVGKDYSAFDIGFGDSKYKI